MPLDPAFEGGARSFGGGFVLVAAFVRPTRRGTGGSFAAGAALFSLFLTVGCAAREVRLGRLCAGDGMEGVFVGV